MPGPPTVLKKRHCLKGKNLFDLVRKFADFEDEFPRPLARVKINRPTEEMDRGDIITAFRSITGETEKEIFKWANKETDDSNLKILLHLTIQTANEIGEPQGQQLSDDAEDDQNTVNDVNPRPAKKQKINSDGKEKESVLEKRIKELEELAKKDGQQAVKTAKEKVRGLALLSSPSEPLLLVSLEELAKTARRFNDSDAIMYEELYRQFHHNREKVDLPGFVLNVLGGRASDIVTKALSKSLKDKNANTPESATVKQQDVQSPLTNLYPPYGMFGSPMQTPYAMHGYQYGYMPYGYNQGQRRYQPRNQFRGQTNGRGNCLFGDLPGHLVRNCEKMKAAKNKSLVLINLYNIKFRPFLKESDEESLHT